MIARRLGASLVFASLWSSACPFDSTLPDDAVLLCAADVDCPAPRICDTAVHECVAPGATPDRAAPVLQSAAFLPSVVAVGPVELVLTADEPLGETPTLHFEGSGDPGFLSIDVVGQVARFSLDATAVAAGAWPLGSVELVDVHGNRATRLTPDLALVVDRRPPVILDLSVSHADAAADGLPFSANAGTNQLDIAFVVDEAVAPQAVEAQAGPTAAVCQVGDANIFTCAAQVTDSFTDGRDRVVVTVQDRAGNRAEATVDIDTDLRAPGVIDAVTVLRSPASAAPVGAAVAGGSIELELILDEPLGASPVVALTGDVAITDAFVEQLTSVRWRWRADVADVGAAGTAVASAVLEDLVRNVVTLELAAIPLAHAVLSPCAALDASAECVDFDGDGDFAITIACGARGGDCDDTDPLTRSDGAEIPGDGADNDCAGDGDLPIDESAGVFVDPSAPAGGPGTRASPARSIDEAVPLLAGRSWLFLLWADGWSYTMSEDLRTSLLGGLDAGWARVHGARSTVNVARVSPPATGAAIVVLDGVALVNRAVQTDVWLVVARSWLPFPGPLVATRRVTAVDSALSNVVIAAGVTGSLVARSTIGDNLDVGDGSDLLIVGSDGDDLSDGDLGPDLVVGAGARLDVVSSRVPSIGCDGCRLRVTHSVIGTSEPGVTALIDVTGSPWPIELRNNIFSWPDGDPGDSCVMNDSGQLMLLGNLFYAPFAGALLVVDEYVSANDIDAVNLCEPNCVAGDANLYGDPRFSTQPGHIELSSPALGAAVASYQGLPASVAVDIDGDCRTAVAPEIGADEK